MPMSENGKMKRPTLSRVLAIVGGLLLAIQLVPYGWNHTNPAVVAYDPALQIPAADPVVLSAEQVHDQVLTAITQEVAAMLDEGRLVPLERLRHQLVGRRRGQHEARLAPADKAALIAGLAATLGTEDGGAGAERGKEAKVEADDD